MKDLHGELRTCSRCGYPAQVTRAVAYGGFLQQIAPDSFICWNGRECSLRFRRKRPAMSPKAESPCRPHPAQYLSLIHI